MSRPLRPQNGYGTGNRAIVSFDPERAEDIKAKEIAAILTGKRKFSSTVKAFLCALDEIYDRTGQLPDPEAVFSSVVGGMLSGSGFGSGLFEELDAAISRKDGVSDADADESDFFDSFSF